MTNDEIAQVIQLSVEYDPQPPFDAGAPKAETAHNAPRTYQFNEQTL